MDNEGGDVCKYFFFRPLFPFVAICGSTATNGKISLGTVTRIDQHTTAGVADWKVTSDCWYGKMKLSIAMAFNLV